ncbi:MAG: hypothetical protein ACRD2C_19880 [Acidimicrobiales bacterium]
MDGFGFGRLTFLITALIVVLSAGCSVSLADTSPDVLDYCPVATTSEHGSTAQGDSRSDAAAAYNHESDCVPRLSGP